MPSQVVPPELHAALASAENLPSLPAVAVEVLRLTEDEDCTLDDLASVLQGDPALSAKLLKLSNSSLFNLGQEVTTLQRATMVLGLKTVKLMSLSFSLASSLPREGDGALDLSRFWRRSLVAAVAGRSLARLTGARFGDEAFLCGLLSHLGQLVLGQCLPEVYAPVLARAGERWPSLALERRTLGFTGADVADALLADWRLPAPVRVPVAHLGRPHDLPADVDPDLRRLTFHLAVTSLAVDVLCEEEAGAEAVKLNELMERHFDVAAGELDAWLIGLESDVRETADLLNVELPTDVDHAALVERARLRMVEVSLGTSAELRHAERRAVDLTVKNRELLDRALRDKLTGLPNRAAFDEALEREVESRRAPGRPRCLGLLLFDVDRFKRFNDEHGHQAGDAVLTAVGRALAGLTRRGDLAARYGGEEFALILPATTPSLLRGVAERVRRAIEARVIPFAGRDLRVTASFGGACLARAAGAGDGAALVRAADAALYRAKEGGRNRTEVRPRPLDGGPGTG